MKIHFIAFLCASSLFLLAQPLAAQTSEPKTDNPESEYDAGNVKARSEKAHKKSDAVNAKNQKAQEKANKEAEKNRKDKLNHKKKKEDAHEFKF
jgi:hypothetical protein